MVPDNLISIIIPVYKTSPDLLQRCILSVNSQTDVEKEVIIICDGTPGESIQGALANLPEGFNSVTVAHTGVSAARNLGMRLAKGRWLTFVDSDDELLPGALHSLLEAGIEHNAQIVMGAHISHLSSMTEKHQFWSKTTVFKDSETAIFMQSILRPQTSAGLVWGKLISRDLLRQSDRLCFNQKLTMGEDSDFMLRTVANATGIVVIPDYVYCYYRNEISTVRMFRIDYVQRVESSMEVTRHYLDDLPNAAQFKEEFQNYVAFHLLILLVNYIFNPNAPWSSKERRLKYKQILQLPLFHDSLRGYNPNAFSLTRKMTLRAMRYHLYVVSGAIAKMRQCQLRRRPLLIGSKSNHMRQK